LFVQNGRFQQREPGLEAQAGLAGKQQQITAQSTPFVADLGCGEDAEAVTDSYDTNQQLLDGTRK